jgi:hypothetical protein
MYLSTNGSTLRPVLSVPEQSLSGLVLRQAALWLGLGGALFVLTYALELVFGLRYGREHSSADVATLRLAWAILFAFTLSLLVIAVRLIMPPFLIADLPFATWGAALVAAGLVLRRHAGR